MRVLILILLILCFYLPFTSHSFNSVDDQEMLNTLLNTADKVDYFHLFFPKKHTYYYRPLLWLSFIFDQKTHFCSAYFMHLENVLIHIFNVLIVFFIAKSLFKHNLPVYLTVFIFGIHPINTEAVNWISARTDILAGFFCFLAFFILIKYKNYFAISLSALFYLAGLLCKETAIGFLPFAFIFMLYLYREKFSLKYRAFFVTVFILATVTYFFMRFPELRFWQQKTTANLNQLLPKGTKYVSSGSILYQIGVCFKVIGFYFKKLIFPWPLNFAIIKINKLFCLISGILITGFIIFFLLQERGIISISFLWTLCFIAPAILVPLRKLAWTPLAERYVYISSFGIALFLSFLFSTIYQNAFDEKFKKGFQCIFTLYLIVFSISTIHRNYLWQDNYRLYLDTVKKSPDFGPAHNELAIALLKKGKREEAKKHFEIAAHLTKGFPLNSLAKSNVLILEQGKLEPEEVLKRYDKFIEEAKKRKANIAILHKAIKYIEGLMLEGKINEKEKVNLYKKEIEYFKKLSYLDEPAFCHYRIGQLYLALGKKQEALLYFRKANELAPEDAYFKKAAFKLVKKLSKNE